MLYLFENLFYITIVDLSFVKPLDKELLIGFLKNPKYKLMPVLKFIEEYIVPLEKELDWGYSIPYMLTGQLVEHPRSAMKARDENNTNYTQFYRTLLEEQ